MKGKLWSKTLIFLVIFLLSIIGSINYIVDPSSIYLRKKQVGSIAEKLLSSKNGLVSSGLNERVLKYGLAHKGGRFDCIILGSSHVLQISSVRNTGGIKSKCSRLLNLAVSGGSIEDIAIFSYVLLQNKEKPKTVLIAIDPWTFKFGMDRRYKEYSTIYVKMNNLLNAPLEINSTPYIYDLANNLINMEYFYASIRSLFRGQANNAGEYPQSDFKYTEGYVEAVILPDGSLVNSKVDIKNAKENINSGGDYGYKLLGEVYNQSAVSYLKNIVDLYKKNNIEIALVMTPYAPKVFSQGETKVVSWIRVIDRVVSDFALTNNLKVYGSFFSEFLGCKEAEFYDFMHASNKCLGRIDFSY